jgi:hypothetical protein
MRRTWKALALLALEAFVGCKAPTDAAPAGSASTRDAPLAEPPSDAELLACRARWDEVMAAPALPGAGKLDTERVRFLGRARGAMTVFVRMPAVTEEPVAAAERARLAKELPGTRIARLVARHKRDKAVLRQVLLREGYLIAEDPDDAFELESRVKLTELFDAPALVLERGELTLELELKTGKNPEYVIARGPEKGRAATVIFGDRIREAGTPASPALHRDVVALAAEQGTDRMEIVRRTESALLIKARFGETWANAVVPSEGAHLSIACLAEPKATRDEIAKHRSENAWRRRAEAALHGAVTALADDRLPFDRPRNETGPDKDGTLRPYWSSAYLSGRTAFEVDGETYAVYREDGRAWPPSVCVDFVLDTFERASGSWYTPLGQRPLRAKGRLDLSSFGIENRRGVIGFFQFAESRPDLFQVKKLAGKERIPFAQRDAFFQFLLDHADEIRSGDILAIQGLKRDDRVHQHAILVETTDPLTGFAAGLADHMKNPRRRSWEGIMAEAPKRSLLYRGRPLEPILRPLDPESTEIVTASATLPPR